MRRADVANETIQLQVPAVQVGNIGALVSCARQLDRKHHVAVHHLDDVLRDMA